MCTFGARLVNHFLSWLLQFACPAIVSVISLNVYASRAAFHPSDYCQITLATLAYTYYIFRVLSSKMSLFMSSVSLNSYHTTDWEKLFVLNVFERF